MLHADDPKNDAVIDALIAVAEEIDAKPGQVAIAWVKAKGVLPVVGIRTSQQLDDFLAAAAVSLSEEQLGRLDEVSAIPLGYPHELNASRGERAVMTGGRFDQIDYPRRTVA